MPKTSIDRSTNALLGEGAHTRNASIQAGLVTLVDGSVVDLLKIQALCNTQFQETGDEEFLNAANELKKVTGLWKGPQGDWVCNPDEDGPAPVVNGEQGRRGDQNADPHPALKIIIKDVIHDFDGAGILNAMAQHWTSHLAEGHAPRILSEDMVLTN